MSQGSYMNSLLTSLAIGCLFHNGDDVSESVLVTSKLILGSVVGPQLFTAMISALPKQVAIMEIVLYADDEKAEGRAACLQYCE